MRRFVRAGVAVMVVVVPFVTVPEEAGASRTIPAPDGVHSDFNGDGFSDLAIGVPNEDVGEVFDAGAVEVIYGSAGGLQLTAPDDDLISQDSPGVRDTAEETDLFGTTLATGDFNDDGFADLAVGIPSENDGGGVAVLYGSSEGLQAKHPDDQLWTQASRHVDDTPEAGDHFGGALAAQDFNGDGFVDLSIGVPQEGVGSPSQAGAVEVLFGTASGLQATAPADQFIDQDTTDVRGVAETNDWFGDALAGGDFNDDGFGDLAVGVEHESFATGVFVGALAVFYGSASGLQFTSPNDQLLHQGTANVRGHEEASDAFGAALTSGDFNGDGFDDVAVGVPHEGVTGKSNTGSVEVLYGTGSGIQALAPDDQLWTQDSAGVLDQREAGDLFGFQLASGDFNGDGFADLLISILEESTHGHNDEGAFAVLYGSAAGLQATSPDDQFFTEGGNLHDSPGEGDLFGSAVAAGDFDGDGISDASVSAAYESFGFDPAGANGGGVEVLYGSRSGLQATDPDDQFFTQDTPDDTSDGFGSAFAAGDFNADGFPDMAIGIPQDDVDGQAVEGSVEILYGGTKRLDDLGADDAYFAKDGELVDGLTSEDQLAARSRPRTSTATASPTWPWGPWGRTPAPRTGPARCMCCTARRTVRRRRARTTSSSPRTARTCGTAPRRGDVFGSSLAAADFNGDGFGDLAVGVPGEDDGGILSAGGVEILYGTAAGLQGSSPDDQFLKQGTNNLGDTEEEADQLGLVLAAGDFNDDGFADLAMGVQGEDVGTLADAGAVQVAYGTAAGLQGSSPDDQVWTQDSTDVDDTAEAFDDFGNALAAADLNGDGIDDLAIGVFGEDVDGISSAGAVSILFGTAGGLQATSPADQFLFQGDQGIRDTPETGDNYGSALDGGDFNGDGIADLAIGVPGETVTDTGDGAVSVLFGAASGQQALSPDDLLLSQSTADIADDPDFFDAYGAVLSGADFNDDGFADVVVGIPDENLGTAIDAGAANVVFGGASGPQGTSPDDQFLIQDSTSVKDEVEALDIFGNALAAG